MSTQSYEISWTKAVCFIKCDPMIILVIQKQPSRGALKSNCSLNIPNPSPPQKTKQKQQQQKNKSYGERSLCWTAKDPQVYSSALHSEYIIRKYFYFKFSEQLLYGESMELILVIGLLQDISHSSHGRKHNLFTEAATVSSHCKQPLF